MGAQSTITSFGRHVRLIAAKAAVAVEGAAIAIVEVLTGETSVEVSAREARVGSLSRGMISPLEDATGYAFQDGSGRVIHIIG
jgi:hypothetical protein